jgi:hypothetical protein
LDLDLNGGVKVHNSVARSGVVRRHRGSYTDLVS